MATFGRRPQKQPRPGIASIRDRTSAHDAGRPSAMERLREEEAEQERFAKEFEARSRQRRRELEEKQKADELETRASEELLRSLKGLPNPIVFLDIEIRGRSGRVEASGRLEIELFADTVPRTAENFRCLCTGERGRPLHLKGSRFHRIIPDFMAQGGDITNGDGTGGLSIYGPTFKDESFNRLHARSNLLSMANTGPDTNNSQFFILFKQCKHLDRKHVVFGEIIREDGNVMKRMVSLGSESGAVDGSVVIADCGEIRSAEDEQRSRDRYRRPRSRSRSADKRKKERVCCI